MSSNELNRATNPENGRINNNNNNNIRFNETNPVDKSSRRTSSFFGSLLSSISIPNQTPNPSSEPRHYDSPPSGKSLACSTNSEQGSVSTFNPDNMSFSGSPHSATSSSISGYNPQKFDQSPPIAYQQLHHRSFSTSPHSNTLPNGQNPHRRASLSNNWTGLIWSSSSQQPSDSTLSSSVPHHIPNSQSHSTSPDSNASALAPGSAVSSRRASIGPVFRRAFELPTYSSLNEQRESYEPHPHRGRSGSMLSSLGLSETRGDERNQCASTAGKRNQPRRKLSPMGERMIRDHIF